MRLSTIHALVYREIVIKSHSSTFGVLLSFGEPIIQFTFMYALFSHIERMPAFGTDMGLFLATGLIPFFAFMHVSVRVMGAARSVGTLGKLRGISPVDAALARAFVETTSIFVFTGAVIAILLCMGSEALPYEPAEAIQCLIVTVCLAVGVGLINGVLTYFAKAWSLIYGLLGRSMIFFSGVFYVPATLPPGIRYYLSWNPILHCLEWFRMSFYPSYPTIDFDKSYVTYCAYGSLVFGIIIQRARL